MDTTKATEHICDMLEKKKSVTASEISYKYKIPNVQVYGIMKKLETTGAIEKEERDNGKIYTLKDSKKLRKYLANLKEVVDTDPIDSKNGDSNKSEAAEPKDKAKDEKNPSAQKSARDTSKYVFEKQILPKGQCVLAVVRAHQKKNNLSLSELKEVFPDSVIPRFGILNTLSAAKKLSSDRPRYFLKDTQILKTSDGKSAVVCSQLTTERFEKFLEIAKGLGYKIKRA